MKLFNNRKADEEKVEEEIISMVNEGNEQGLIHDDEVEMITNIFEFSEKEVRDVMTPRSDVVGIDKHTTMDETIKIMLENNYSRYPVFDDDLDNIVGILYFKDFVKAYLKDKNQTIEQIMVEPLFVHPTKNISELFKRMQKEKIHMVIVVDEYGQTEGIIAMEDILEEIVGEISDEYDEDEKQYIRLADGSYIFEAKIQLTDFFRATDTDPADFEKITEEVETLAGLLLEIKGDFPRRREVIEYKNYRFQILEMDNRRILKVKFNVINASEDDKEEE